MGTNSNNQEELSKLVKDVDGAFVGVFLAGGKAIWIKYSAIAAVVIGILLCIAQMGTVGTVLIIAAIGAYIWYRIKNSKETAEFNRIVHGLSDTKELEAKTEHTIGSSNESILLKKEFCGYLYTNLSDLRYSGIGEDFVYTNTYSKAVFYLTDKKMTIIYLKAFLNTATNTAAVIDLPYDSVKGISSQEKQLTVGKKEAKYRYIVLETSKGAYEFPTKETTGCASEVKNISNIIRQHQ